MKKLAINTNKHLIDPEKRQKALLESVIGSSEIEGIKLSAKQWETIAKNGSKRSRKAS